jgi:hypothetical protein
MLTVVWVVWTESAPAHLLQADLRKSMKPQYANGDRPVVEMPLKGIPAASLEQQLQKKARQPFLRQHSCRQCCRPLH